MLCFKEKVSATFLSFLMLSFLQLGSVIANAQNTPQDPWVTVNREHISLADLFKSIKKQTGFTLFYSNAVLDDSEKIKFSSGKIRLDDLLTEVLYPKNIAWVYKDQVIILRKKNTAAPARTSGLMNAAVVQQINVGQIREAQVIITGKVVNGEGNPVAGASVQVKGAKRGTATKADGTFKLQIDNGTGTLVISSVGYEDQEIAIDDKTDFLIVLKQAAGQLSDVVVIGYGTRKKSDLTGAVASVSANNL